MTLARPLTASVVLPTYIAQNQETEIGPKKGGKASFAALSGASGYLGDGFVARSSVLQRKRLQGVHIVKRDVMPKHSRLRN